MQVTDNHQSILPKERTATAYVVARHHNVSGMTRQVMMVVMSLARSRNFASRRVKYFLDSFPENEIVLQKIDETTGEFNKTYVIVKGFESHVVRKVQELYNYAVEVTILSRPVVVVACVWALTYGVARVRWCVCVPVRALLTRPCYAPIQSSENFISETGIWLSSRRSSKCTSKRTEASRTPRSYTTFFFFFGAGMCSTDSTPSCGTTSRPSSPRRTTISSRSPHHSKT